MKKWMIFVKKQGKSVPYYDGNKVVIIEAHTYQGAIAGFKAEYGVKGHVTAKKLKY